MLRIGITGGIGSGKTTVCKIFETLGIPVYYADYWAKWLTVNDPDIKTSIVNLLGPESYDDSGQYNRAWVASQVFNNPEKRSGLNAILHPAVALHSNKWQRQLAPDIPYSLKEAALMIESGSYRQLDKIIVVTAPEMLRIQRVMKRDKLTEAQVRSRMTAQIPENEKVKLADYVIHNDGKHSIIQQVWQIHQSIKSI